MKLNQLGTSDLLVSEVTFGCMSLKPGNPDNAILLQKAVDQGINFFDTADLYDLGENERIVGKALKAVRQQVLLSTKVGNRPHPDGNGWDWAPSKSYILKAADESLRRLETNYIDLYMLHGGTLEDPMDEIIEAFEILKTNGKIRAYGISSIRPNTIRAYAEIASIQAVMLQYGLLDRRPDESVLDFLAEHQISGIARGSLAKGLLAGKPARAFLDFSKDEVKQATDIVRSIAGNTRSIEEVAIRFALAASSIATVAVGIRTMEQLDAATRALNNSPLNSDEIRMLQNSIPAFQYQLHR